MPPFATRSHPAACLAPAASPPVPRWLDATRLRTGSRSGHPPSFAFGAPREDDEQCLVSHHELDEERPGVRKKAVDVGSCGSRHQATPGCQRRQPFEEGPLLGRTLLRALGDGFLESRDACGVGLGQPALARKLRVQRYQLSGERSLLFALEVCHPAGDLALARRQQHAKIVSAHPLRRLEGRGRVTVFGLQQREDRERRRRIAGDRCGRPDLGDLEQPIDGGDGFGRRDNGLRPLAKPAQRLRFRNERAPQHVVVLERLGRAASAACGVEGVGVRTTPGERSRETHLRARGLFGSIEARERLDGFPVGSNSVLELLLRRLREGQPGDCARHALLVARGAATGAALPVLVLGQREAARRQIDEAQPLPCASCMRELLQRLEMRAAFDERRPRTVQVAETEVHVADAEQRRALVVAIVARLSFREHAAERVERRTVVPLRQKHAAQTFKGIGFAGSVRQLPVEVPAPRVVRNRGREITLEILHVASADQRRRDRACVVETLLDCERFAVCRQRRGVLRERVANGRDPEQSRRCPRRIVPFAFEREAFFIRLQSALQVALKVHRVGKVLQRLALQPLVADPPGHVAHALECDLCRRVRPVLRRLAPAS